MTKLDSKREFIPYSLKTRLKRINIKGWISARRKRITIIFLIIAAVLFVTGAGYAGYRIYSAWSRRKAAVTVNTVDLKVYYSRSSRDDERKEQYTFSSGDPIQAVFDFEKAESGTVILFKLLKDGGNEKESIQEVEIPLKDSGKRYVTVATSARPLDSGKYIVILEEGGYELGMREFNVE